MKLRDAIIAGIRTGMQRLILLGLVALTTWLTSLGFDIDLSGANLVIVGAIDVIVTGFLTTGLNTLEKKWTWLTTLLSIGTSGSPASYEPPSVDPGVNDNDLHA